MTRDATSWWWTIALALTGILGRPNLSGAQAPAPQPFQPTPAVIAAWKQAGAVFGWTSIGPEGDWRFDQDEPPITALPAFRFSRFPAAKVQSLPPPGVPFGLWLGRSVKDADLKPLAGLKQLHSLNLAQTQVSDVGVRELQKALPEVHISR